MPDAALARYHIGEQSAAVLLGPILAELATVEARLAHWHDRLRMPDVDRATIGRARDVVARARADVAALDA